MILHIRSIVSRFLGLFRNRSLEARLEEELKFHLEMQAEDNQREGMTPLAARSEALRSFGGVDQSKEQCRDVRSWRYLHDFSQDIRFGARMLRRKPKRSRFFPMTSGEENSPAIPELSEKEY
jgi:putative ABC transport system permease protein